MDFPADHLTGWFSELPKENLVKRTLVSLTVAGSLFLAAPAAAQPSLPDVRAATSESRQLVAAALDAASNGMASRAATRLSSAAMFARISALKARQLSNVREVRGARAMTAAAGGLDQSFADLSGPLGGFSPQVQAQIAAALEQFAAMRGTLVAKLTELAGQLPEPARSKVLEAIAMIHDAGDLDALLGVIGDPDVSSVLRGQLTEILAMVSAQLDSVFVQLEGIVAMLPPEASAIVGDVLTQLQANLAGIFTMLDGVLAGLPGGFGDLPVPGGIIPGELCGIVDSLPIPIPLPLCN